MNVEYFTKRNNRPMTPASETQLQRARQVRSDNHYHRKHVLDCLREGHLSLAQFREMRTTDPRLNCLRVKHVVYACVGKQRGNRFLKEIAPKYKRTADQFAEMKVARLGPDMWFRLIGRVDSARHPTTR